MLNSFLTWYQSKTHPYFLFTMLSPCYDVYALNIQLWEYRACYASYSGWGMSFFIFNTASIFLTNKKKFSELEGNSVYLVLAVVTSCVVAWDKQREDGQEKRPPKNNNTMKKSLLEWNQRHALRTVMLNLKFCLALKFSVLRLDSSNAWLIFKNKAELVFSCLKA